MALEDAATTASADVECDVGGWTRHGERYETCGRPATEEVEVVRDEAKVRTMVCPLHKRLIDQGVIS